MCPMFRQLKYGTIFSLRTFFTISRGRQLIVLTKGWSFLQAFLSSLSLPTAIPDMF